MRETIVAAARAGGSFKTGFVRHNLPSIISGTNTVQNPYPLTNLRRKSPAGPAHCTPKSNGFELEVLKKKAMHMKAAYFLFRAVSGGGVIRTGISRRHRADSVTDAQGASFRTPRWSLPRPGRAPNQPRHPDPPANTPCPFSPSELTTLRRRPPKHQEVCTKRLDAERRRKPGHRHPPRSQRVE